LQPEPLLYLGIPEELRSDPRALMMYRYGHNAPSVYADPSGFAPAWLVAAGGLYRAYTIADTAATATDYVAAGYALYRGDGALAREMAYTATMGAGTPVPNGLATARAAKRYGPELAASAARMGEGVVEAVSRTADEAVDFASKADDVVTLWKAPAAGRTGVAEEVASGFSASRYPGLGPFFSETREGATIWQRIYGNGMQEINIPRPTYDKLVSDGVIARDFYQADAVHVPASGLDAFNAAIKEGPPNVYYPEAP
jgi:hypothetical protein